MSAATTSPSRMKRWFSVVEEDARTGGRISAPAESHGQRLHHGGRVLLSRFMVSRRARA
jgi:hypothetical protein